MLFQRMNVAIRADRSFLQGRLDILGSLSGSMMQHKRTTNIASMEHVVDPRLSFG